METLKFTRELDLTRFEFWSGAKEHKFTYKELSLIECVLEDLYHEKAPTETEINDLFWFEEELICEWLNIDFEEYTER